MLVKFASDCTNCFGQEPSWDDLTLLGEQVTRVFCKRRSVTNIKIKNVDCKRAELVRPPPGTQTLVNRHLIMKSLVRKPENFNIDKICTHSSHQTPRRRQRLSSGCISVSVLFGVFLTIIRQPIHHSMIKENL